MKKISLNITQGKYNYKLKYKNSVNTTLKKMTMEITFREDKVGRRDLWVIGGVGDWGEVEKYTEFYHWISNSD